MSNANPPFQDLSLDPAEMIARKRGIRSRIVKRFRISGNWKWIAKSSPGEFCGPQDWRARRQQTMRAGYPWIDRAGL